MLVTNRTQSLQVTLDRWDAIHVTGWISLFTLHVLWPFLWVWATLYREDRGWGFADGKPGTDRVSLLEQKVTELSKRFDAMEGEGVIVGSVVTRPASPADFSPKNEETKKGVYE